MLNQGSTAYVYMCVCVYIYIYIYIYGSFQIYSQISCPENEEFFPCKVLNIFNQSCYHLEYALFTHKKTILSLGNTLFTEQKTTF